MQFGLKVSQCANSFFQFQNGCIWVEYTLNFSRRVLTLKFRLHFGDHTDVSFDGDFSSLNPQLDDLLGEVELLETFVVLIAVEQSIAVETKI